VTGFWSLYCSSFDPHWVLATQILNLDLVSKKQK
jgi:hypothetical protein